ncbi:MULTISPECIES: hypothetical protein [Burkholderia cepacia complex]|nr:MULTISPECIES: hypothetical protein [Burkholderia cepacia complex]
MADTASRIPAGIRICLKHVMRDESLTLEMRYGKANKENSVRDF